MFTYPPFIFDIFDHDDDLFDSSPDYLCRAVVEPEDCEANGSLIKLFDCIKHGQDDCKQCAEDPYRIELPEKPAWNPCYYSPGQPKCGELLISFAVAPADY